MKCEEFREKMLNDTEDESLLEKHLLECEECNAWLEGSLEVEPSELKKMGIETPGKNALPDFNKYVSSENGKEETANKSFWEYYFSGMKYGMVFAVAIVVGFALLPIINPQYNQQKDEIDISKVSFIEEEKLNFSFLEENKISDVTFLENGDSKLVSFVEIEKIPTFIEEEKENT